jgi:small subunit ribosomal protein S9
VIEYYLEFGIWSLGFQSNQPNGILCFKELNGNHKLSCKRREKVAERIYATGKRKSSIARVWLEPGEGKFLVNERGLQEYFGRETCGIIARQPLNLTGTQSQFDVVANVEGGGISGQSEAIRHGISKALLQYNPDLKDVLKRAGFLTRDSRIKERKKYGRRGARRRPQFSKR